MLRYHNYSILILFIFSLGAITNQVLGQETIPDEVIIDYSAIDKTLREVLFDISDISDVPIAFQEEILPGDSLINFSVRQQEIGVVVNYLLDRHRVKYKVVGNQLVLFKDAYARSRKRITISGYLTDLRSGESLLGANVYLSDNETGTETNSYGYYSFTIPKGSQSVYYSYLGYNTEILNLELVYDTIINVKLDPNNLLSEIVITDTRIIDKKVLKEPAADVDIIEVDKISSKLPIAGEPDLLRMAYTLPGVTTGADGFGGMSVRGGSTNQNLILFDGIPVYNSNHLFGLFSIFNTNVVKSAKLYKGAFPSHFSGRLSSVMDIRTRDGNNQEFGGDISLGLLTAKASIEGPIRKGRSSFLISARRTTADLWIDAVNDLVNNNPLTNRDTGIKFYDFNAKLNFSIGQQSKLMLSYYKGNDNFENKLFTDNQEMTIRNLNELSWESGNELASIKWQIPLSKRIFLNTSFYKSDYIFQSFDHDRVEIVEGGLLQRSNYDAGYYNTNISDLGARLDFDIIPSPKHYVKIGAGFINHSFSPEFIFSVTGDGLLETAEDVATKDRLQAVGQGDNLKGNEIELYVEDAISLGKHTVLNLGYNQMIVSLNEDNDNNLIFIPQPRILFSTGSDKYKFKLSWGRMGQYLHSLTNTGLGVPSDIWLPSTNVLIPEIAWNASMGHEFNLKNQTQFSLDLFYKRMKNVTRNGVGILNISEDSDWESNIPLGTGLAYGSEWRIKKTQGNTSYDLAYTLSWSNRNYPMVNNGEDIRFRYDRRHVINFSFLHKFNENIELSTNWEYGSGTPLELPTDSRYRYLDIEGNETVVEVNRETIVAEFPSYHRLDIGFNFYSQYKWGKSKLTLGIYNIYDRVNPLYIDQIVTSDNKIRYEQFYLFKLMPTFNYTIDF